MIHTPDILFHIPHDGNEFPEELMSGVNISEKEFMSYHERMRDTAVFNLVPAAYRYAPYCLRFDVSRLLCDVERFIGPEEIMEKYGMGFCYEKAYDGKRIKRINQTLKDAAMVYYRRHHKMLDEIAMRSGNLLLIDLHSFSEETIPRNYLKYISGETDSGAEELNGHENIQMPDVCIGMDPVYTPEFLAKETKKLFTNAGFLAAVNYPYKGCMVPNVVLNKRTGGIFAGIMIEVNKKAYLNKQNEVIESRAGKIREVMEKIIRSYSRQELMIRESRQDTSPV